MNIGNPTYCLLAFINYLASNGNYDFGEKNGELQMFFLKPVKEIDIPKLPKSLCIDPNTKTESKPFETLIPSLISKWLADVKPQLWLDEVNRIHNTQMSEILLARKKNFKNNFVESLNPEFYDANVSSNDNEHYSGVSPVLLLPENEETAEKSQPLEDSGPAPPYQISNPPAFAKVCLLQCEELDSKRKCRKNLLCLNRAGRSRVTVNKPKPLG